MKGCVLNTAFFLLYNNYVITPQVIKSLNIPQSSAAFLYSQINANLSKNQQRQ